MSLFSSEALQEFVSAHGYWGIALIVGLESMGIPLPGETVLVLAAIYAAADPTLDIWLVIAAAAVGSIVGDNLGYWIGQRYAYKLLVRYGRYIGMSLARIKVGQYLFREYGGKVVFFGRFVALLRILAAFLAGLNRMPWRSFLLANAAGAVLWAITFGLGGYYFGRLLFQLHSSLAAVVFVIGLTTFFGIGYLARRYEHRLITAAERALPGPLEEVIPQKLASGKAATLPSLRGGLDRLRQTSCSGEESKWQGSHGSDVLPSRSGLERRATPSCSASWWPRSSTTGNSNQSSR